MKNESSDLILHGRVDWRSTMWTLTDFPLATSQNTAGMKCRIRNRESGRVLGLSAALKPSLIDGARLGTEVDGRSGWEFLPVS